MAGGWSKDGAVQEQIDASVEDAVKLARSKLKGGVSATHCEECEAQIPVARQKAIAGVQLCVRCQTAVDEQETRAQGFNRRGSKDSQLR